MDKQIERKTWSKKRIWMACGGLLLLALTVMAYNYTSTKTFRTSKEKLMLSTVTEGNFQDVVVQTGSVEPLKTVFVNSLQGGVVEKIFVENGVVVDEGTPILKLNNPNAQMNYLSQQTSIVQNISQLRNIKLQLETKTRELKENLIDMDDKLGKAENQFRIDTQLFKGGAISKLEHDNSTREYRTNKARKELLKETIAQEERNRQSQLDEISASIQNLEQQLVLVREGYDNLTIKAPVTGRISSFDPIIGKNYAQGELLGKIDVLKGYRLDVQVDEYYINRLREGQEAVSVFNGEEYKMTVHKVLPEVTKGNFQVELTFTGALPPNLNRGQTAQVKILLSNDTKALMIKRGQFFESAGGNWVFVIKGGKALRRPVKLGRKNYQYYEVLDGLEKGEEVIVSGYTDFLKYDELILE